MEEVPVRVAVRVRPLVGQEKTHNVPKCITFVPDKPQLILGKDRAFTFDYVFQPTVAQAEVYKTCVAPLVESCFDGYNATVFAYGQTGSGKTYTIGSANTAELLDEEYGVIPRATEQIFHTIQERQNKVDFVVSVSYIEIYMEEVRDLLDLETSTKDIHIREDEHGNTVITGATEQVIETADEALSCLDAGSAGRHVGSTNMNEHSSRSHAIFTIYIEQHAIQSEEQERNKQVDENEPTAEFSQFMSAKFHFVDLAGSERAHRTGNVGERFKESVHINSGLLALGNVISALSDAKKKAGHIPYRSSKITRILKDSLGGNARTVMLTCLSPAAADLAENLNSLKYATRARYIKNKPIVNRDPQAAKLAEMEDEIQALREELQRHRTKTLESLSDVGDITRMKEITDELERCQHDLEVVRSLLDEATMLLKEVYKANGMNKAISQQYEQLKKKVEKLKKGLQVSGPNSAQRHQNEIIEELRKELEKYKADLATDEEIFAERTQESDSLRQHIKELELENGDLSERLKDVLEKLKKYDDQLLRQQVQLNKQMVPAVLDNGEESTPKINHQAITADLLSEDELSTRRSSLQSSPVKNPMERMMQNFRARSDLLVGQYEEEDEVLHSLSDTTDSEQEEKTGKEKLVSASKTLGKTWNAKDRRANPEGRKIFKKRSSHSQSCVARQRNSVVKKRSEIAREEKSKQTVVDEEIHNLRMSTQVIQGQVQESELRLREAQHQLRDLTINIKLKEELIKELVRSDKEANVMKKTFTEKVQQMEKEVERKKKDLQSTQKTLAQYEVKSHREQSEKQKLEQEYKKKLQTLEEQLQEWKKKQKDNERVSILHEEREKKLKELENHLERMKQQQDTFQRKLKEETEKKTKMEREMQRDQQRIKDLEDKNVQNEKILKRKTEEVVSAQRKLRRKTSKEENTSVDASKLDERRQWLDSEVEKVLHKKQAMERLQEELAKREAILKERELMVKSKNELQMKKLRSSQVLSKDILRMSTQLNDVEEQLRAKDSVLKESEDQKTCNNIRQEIRSLETKRQELMSKRQELDAKLKDGSLLSVEEERRLLEFDEGIEALEAAIEFKTESINTQEKELASNENDQSQNHLVTKLNSLRNEDAIFLLSKYFEKVVTHRENERKQQLKCDDLSLRVNEQERIIRELERGYQQADLRAERRLTDQAKQYEQRIQFLMKQVNDLEQQTTGGPDSRIQELEKDLYYYKKVSRDLKKKLRELVGKDGVVESQASVQSEAPSEAETPGVPADMKSQERKESKGTADTSLLKNVLEKASGSQPSTPVRVSRRDLRELSEKEVSVRRSQPTSRSATVTGDSRKSSLDKSPLLRLSEKNARKERESFQGVSLQDSIEQSGNPWT